jgi:hypothetical protein
VCPFACVACQEVLTCVLTYADSGVRRVFFHDPEADDELPEISRYREGEREGERGREAEAAVVAADERNIEV